MLVLLMGGGIHSFGGMADDNDQSKCRKVAEMDGCVLRTVIWVGDWSFFVVACRIRQRRSPEPGCWGVPEAG